MKIKDIYNNINQSIDFAAKFSNTKNGFPKHTPLIFKKNYDDISVQPTYFSMGYPVYNRIFVERVSYIEEKRLLIIRWGWNIT